MAVNPKQFEDARDEQRIEWRLPGSWSSVFVKGIAKNSPGDQRARDASHLETKTKIILDDFKFICVSNQDVAQSKSKSSRHHPGKRCAKLCPIAAAKTGSPVLQWQSCAGNASHNNQSSADATFVADDLENKQYLRGMKRSFFRDSVLKIKQLAELLDCGRVLWRRRPTRAGLMSSQQWPILKSRPAAWSDSSIFFRRHFNE